MASDAVMVQGRVVMDGEVVELARHGFTPSGRALLRVKLSENPNDETPDRHMNLFVLGSDSDGLALGVRVRVALEIVSPLPSTNTGGSGVGVVVSNSAKEAMRMLQSDPLSMPCEMPHGFQCCGGVAFADHKTRPWCKPCEERRRQRIARSALGDIPEKSLMEAAARPCSKKHGCLCTDVDCVKHPPCVACESRSELEKRGMVQ